MDSQGDPGPRIGALWGARRKGIDLSQPVAVTTRFLGSGPSMPLVVEPEGGRVDPATWAESNREFIDSRLLAHGAVLFRGFAVDSVPEFERFAAVLCPELFGEYGDLPRDEVSGKVYSSTPYPADQPILFHNESSHLNRWPMKIWFSCVIPARSGGETPIVDCRQVYEQLDPAVRERFREKKLMYVRNYVEGLDVSWSNFFQTDDRGKVEAYCRNAGVDLEWKDGNGLKTRQIAPAVVRHPQTGEMVFFNQIQLHHASCLEPAVRESLLSLMGPEDLPRNVFYGDGTPIEDSVVSEIRALYDGIAVKFLWKAGDILMVNNMLVAHSRSPFEGPRKIVVAMGEMVDRKDVDAKA